MADKYIVWTQIGEFDPDNDDNRSENIEFENDVAEFDNYRDAERFLNKMESSVSLADDLATAVSDLLYYFGQDSFPEPVACFGPGDADYDEILSNLTAKHDEYTALLKSWANQGDD